MRARSGGSPWAVGAAVATAAALVAPQARGAPDAPPDESAPADADADVPPAPVSPEAKAIAELHRTGDERFENEDYAGARMAWLDALSRVAPGPTEAAYRVSLLSLVVSAALADFAESGNTSIIDETAALVDDALAEPGLDPALRDVLEHGRERLAPLVSPAPLPPPAPPTGTVALGEGVVSPTGVDPTLWMIVAGSVGAGFGFAAIGAGSAFKPRAKTEVVEAGGTINNALSFVNREIRKGQIWIGVGSAVAAVGLGTLVTGIVLRRRSRKPSRTSLSAVISNDRVGLTLRGHIPALSRRRGSQSKPHSM